MHENTKAALLLIENFIDEYGDGLPAINVEVLNGSAEIHLHLDKPEQVTQVHRALGSPQWEITTTGTAAGAVVEGMPVTVYFSHVRDEPEAQAPLRAAGLVKGLVAL